ncbi:MAG: hypothetical protein EXS16_10475 [Gemmataceae bacterium]|nr:hypothetical protein [Gemmataceae bacterium]
MISRIRLTAIAFFVGIMAAFPLSAQQLPKGKITPKLEPIAETKLLMEGLAHANFRGLERNLLKNPIDDQSWTFARGQALLIAETANLLMMRPPKTQGQATWFEHTMNMRTQATQLAQRLAKKDIEQSKLGMTQLAGSCNRCHQTFRVPVEIVPFPAPDAPPARKV